MAKLIATRTAQFPLAAEFSFSIVDTMLNAAGVMDNFSTVAAHVFEGIPLPAGATVLSGHVVTDIAVTGSTAYNVKVGDSLNDARYLTSTDKTAAGLTALVPTGSAGTGENVRITVTPTVAAATAGKLTVRLVYTVANRTNEVQIA